MNMLGWAIPSGLEPVLRCNWCAGKGKVATRSGDITVYDVLCNQCCGQGILPIPYCELNLPVNWGRQ